MSGHDEQYLVLGLVLLENRKGGKCVLKAACLQFRFLLKREKWHFYIWEKLSQKRGNHCLKVLSFEK